MNIEFFRSLSNDNQLRWFPRKAFGVELMFILEQLEEQESSKGIDDTWLLIEHNRPQKGTFSLYVNELQTEGVIDIIRSKQKRSRKILRLSKTSKNALIAMKEQFIDSVLKIHF
jgi:hypothetical protein